MFFFSPNDRPSKTMKKCFLFHLKSSFHSRHIQIFLFPSHPVFLTVSHYFRGWLKTNLNVYDVMNCINKNLIIHFVSYLEKKKRCDIETLSIDKVLNKKDFLLENYAENVHQRLVPDFFLILVSNPKQPLHARNCFKNKIFWKSL